MLGPTLLPNAPNIRLVQVRADWGRIELVITTATLGAICPCCGRVSRRVHSRYMRHLADLPMRKVQVGVELHVRKFYCDTLGCERSIFTERVTGFAERYARRTIQLDEMLRLIAFANGGECGSRVAGELCIAISPQSLLRLIRRQGIGAVVCGQIIGIDDWSFAKRKRYGAMVVDLEAHRVVDLLPDRLAETTRDWMNARPQIEIVSRDRGDNFIVGVTAGAPQARQVADRWHLHHNLGQMLKQIIEQHLGELHQVIRGHWHDREQLKWEAPQPVVLQLRKRESSEERQRRERDVRYRERFDLVHGLACEGKSGREIAKRTGLSRNTVRGILSQPTYPGVPQRGPRASPIDAYTSYIAGRMAQGCVNALQLFREIAAQGFAGGYEVVWRHVRRWVLDSGLIEPGQEPLGWRPKPIDLPMPTSYEIIRWLLDKQHTLTLKQTEVLEQWLHASPALQACRRAAQWFTEILTRRQPEQFDAWIADACESGVSPLRRFAKGIRADHDAVLAALQLPWSNAQLEGQVNRLKLIKRQMYGRAKFDLLKLRVMTKV